MPAPFPTRQPASTPARPPAPARGCAAWFDTAPGRALLGSESESVREALDARPGQPWLWLAPVPMPGTMPGRGVRLSVGDDAWTGDVRCGFPLPFCSDAFAGVVLQHVADLPLDAGVLLEECARVLVPGGQAWLFALNPLTPYRRHWWGTPLSTREPLTWRRRLRAAGLEPEPVSAGLGPRWRVAEDARRQDGPGLRAAWLLRARKRVAAVVPPAPAPALRWQPGLTAWRESA